MSFLPHNYAIEQDVAGDLEIFVQLANVGHIGRAIRSFDNYLTVHQESFPVAAEHAEALMDQGDFRNADDFLSHVSVDISPSSKEREALDLMHALVRMHTRMECAEALKLAKATLLIRETHSLASLDVLDMQIVILGFRIADESIRTPSNQSEMEASRALLDSISRLMGGSREDFEYTIETLCEEQRLWGARVLLDIFVRNLASIDWIEEKSASFLMRLFALIPAQHDPAVSLLKLSMITDLCFNIVISDRDGRIPQIHGIEALIDDNIWAWERPENYLEAIDTRLCETRQYDHLLFLGQVVDSQSPIRLLLSAVQSFVRRNSYSAHHDISLQEQLALVHCNQLKRLDLQYIYAACRDRHDRLAYYRLMKALSPASKTAASIAEQPFDAGWGDTVEFELVTAQVKGNWAQEYTFRLEKVMALCAAAFIGFPPRRNTMNNSTTLALHTVWKYRALMESGTISKTESLRESFQAIEGEAETLLLYLNKTPSGKEVLDEEATTAGEKNMRLILVMLRQLAAEFPQLSTAVDMSALSSAIVGLSHTNSDTSQKGVAKPVLGQSILGNLGRRASAALKRM